MGHGLTLVVVGVCVLLLRISNLDNLSHFGEKLVGYMLMGIGFWGLWGLFGQYLLIFTSKFFQRTDCGKLFEEVRTAEQ